MSQLESIIHRTLPVPEPTKPVSRLHFTLFVTAVVVLGVTALLGLYRCL